MPTLSQLEYLVAVDRLGHFGRAATACHISQPSLSMQILKVEKEVGFAIFDRLKKPVASTERGRQFIDQAKNVLLEHQRLLQVSKGRGTATVSGRLRLGVIPTLSPYLVPRFIGSFAKTYPEIEVNIDEAKTTDIVSALRDDHLDAGIAATPLEEKGIEELLLFDEPFYVYAHQDEDLLKRDRLTPQDLKRRSLWLLEDGHCLRHQVTKLCFTPERNVIPSVRFEGGTLETIRQLIRHNGGATLVPELFVRDLPEAERKESIRSFSAPIPSRRISLIFRKGHWKEPLFKALAATVTSQIEPQLRSTPTGKMKILPLNIQ